MKLPCEMVQDLLPLYHDGVCSEVSAALVREHLAQCGECRNVLERIDAALEVPEAEKAAAEGLLSVKKRWEKSISRACVKGFCIAALVFAVIAGGMLALTQWKCLPITTQGMEVAEIYRLEDGRILYRLKVPKDAWCREFKFEDHDGKSYKIPVRAILELNEKEGWPSVLDDYQMIDAGEGNAWRETMGAVPVAQWYIGRPGEALLVYEEGMAVAPAPAELEVQFGGR